MWPEKENRKIEIFKKMLKIEAKSLCCGCEACAYRCPKACIAMERDEEGFLYPRIDTARCIDCGLCEKV